MFQKISGQVGSEKQKHGGNVFITIIVLNELS
jgi:hypothetical protein